MVVDTDYLQGKQIRQCNKMAELKYSEGSVEMYDNLRKISNRSELFLGSQYEKFFFPKQSTNENVDVLLF